MYHYDDAYNHFESTNIKNKSWISDLDHEKNIGMLLTSDTHDSASFYGESIFQTQFMPIEKQLNSGVRFWILDCVT